MMAVIMDSIDSLSLAMKELHVAGVFYWLEQPSVAAHRRDDFDQED